jgi:6-oxo-cyclohex-1-ene-carbonyl-CoA hydrolase
MNAQAAKTGNGRKLVDYDLAREVIVPGVILEKRPARCSGGHALDGLYNAWITLDNPKQYNSYTTEMVKGVILAFRQASAMRDVVAVAEYFAGNPQEYRQYMRLFNDMVSAILSCDKPVVCRVNGMRVGGGQEIGMACDFSIAQDLARFGQAGPKHGSAPIGGATDFLPLMIGCEQGMVSGILCEPWSAHKAYRMGIISDLVPALKVDGEFVPNPLVETSRYLDEYGRIVHGESKTADELKAGKELLATGTVDLTLLDQAVDTLCSKFVYMFPDCLTKTLEELRKPKLNAWNANKEHSRAWLALNMMTEARAGFRAFNEPAGGEREIDFIGLRLALAAGEPWTDELTESLLPAARHAK